MVLGFFLQGSTINKEGIYQIDPIQKRSIQNIKSIGEKKKFRDNHVKINRIILKKGYKLGGVAVKIVPDSLFGIGLSRMLTQIASRHGRK